MLTFYGDLSNSAVQELFHGIPQRWYCERIQGLVEKASANCQDWEVWGRAINP